MDWDQVTCPNCGAWPKQLCWDVGWSGGIVDRARPHQERQDAADVTEEVN